MIGLGWARYWATPTKRGGEPAPIVRTPFCTTGHSEMALNSVRGLTLGFLPSPGKELSGDKIVTGQTLLYLLRLAPTERLGETRGALWGPLLPYTRVGGAVLCF